MLVGVFWLLPLLFLALYCAPINQDGLSYHLVRVQHWIQNQNVYYYPTNFTVQNYYNVLSEYLLLHSQLLSGSDYFMNGVQFVAMVGSLVAASLVAQRMGGSSRGQWFTLVLVLTIPMGILQSTTTQNDYLTGFFTLCSVYWGITLLKTKATNDRSLIGWLALSVSLGGFTKYSYFLIALPFVCWFGLVCLQRRGVVNASIVAGSCIVVLLLIFGPFWYRNYQVLGSILSPPADSPLFLDKYNNERLDGAGILSNVIKNLGMHLALPSQSYNDALLSGVNKLHQWLGVSTSDPATTMGEYRIGFTINEDTSTNYVHLLLALVAIILAFVKSTDRFVRLYSLCILGSWIVYSAGFKWQYYHSRTQLPLFLLTAPLIGVVLSEQLVKRQYILNSISILLLLMALPYVYTNNGKSLVPVRSLAKQAISYSPASVKWSDFPAYRSHQQLAHDLARIGYTQSTVAPEWYDCPAGQHPAYSSLKAMGYSPPQDPSIWQAKSRQEMFYLVSGDQSSDWNRLMAILKKGQHHSIGLVIEGPELIYPLWPLMHQAFEESASVNYVYFPIILSELGHNRLRPTYTCIVSNLGYTEDIVPKEYIKRIHQVGRYQVVELDGPSSLVYNSRETGSDKDGTSRLASHKAKTSEASKLIDKRLSAVN
jgi:hypothetical protein